MGRDHHHDENSDGDHDGQPSTSCFILVALADAAPTAMTTYQLGLLIIDDHSPPRPVSVVIKTLAKDGYVKATADAGKRARAWTITDRGIASLDRRPIIARLARLILKERPNVSRDETMVLRTLLHKGESGASLIATATGLPASPIRTAIKRLVMRGAARVVRPHIYEATPSGRSMLKGRMSHRT